MILFILRTLAYSKSWASFLHIPCILMQPSVWRETSGTAWEVQFMSWNAKTTYQFHWNWQGTTFRCRDIPSIAAFESPKPFWNRLATSMVDCSPNKAFVAKIRYPLNHMIWWSIIHILEAIPHFRHGRVKYSILNVNLYQPLAVSTVPSAHKPQVQRLSGIYWDLVYASINA